MKRSLVLLFVLLLIMGLTACAGGDAENRPTPTDAPDGSLELPTLTIGALFTLSGESHNIGASQLNAMRLWLDQRNWQIGPYQIVLNYRDDRGLAETAVNGAQELVETGADLLFGGHLAEVCRAIGEIAIISRVPYIIPAAAGDDITQRGRNDLLIRTGGSSSQATHPFGYWAHNMRGIQTVGIIAADDTLSHERVAGFMRTFEEAGGEVLGVPVWIPPNTANLTPFLNQIPQEADALFIQFEGADAERVPEAIYNMDWNREELLLLISGESFGALTLAGLNSNLAIGIYSVSPWLPIDADTSHWGNALEDRLAQIGMEISTALDILETAILEANGFIDNFDAFLEAIRSVEVATPHGTVTIDEWNNATRDIHIRQMRLDGSLVGKPVYTFSAVSQFWRYDPTEFLALPAYDRDFRTEIHNQLLDDMRLYRDEVR